MHRIPNFKDQARIVREVCQGKGVSLEVAESLELVARLNGFADWNAAAAAQKVRRPKAAHALSDAEYELTLVTWHVVHHHKHGHDTFPVYRDESPTEAEAIALINSQGGGYEPELGEWYEVLGPERSTIRVKLSNMKAVSIEQPIPGVAGDSTGCLEVNLADEFEYDTPDDLPEWTWISANCSFVHKENGIEPSVWEEMVRVQKALDDPELPERLKPFFLKARALGCKWVLFYQD